MDIFNNKKVAQLEATIESLHTAIDAKDASIARLIAVGLRLDDLSELLLKDNWDLVREQETLFSLNEEKSDRIRALETSLTATLNQLMVKNEELEQHTDTIGAQQRTIMVLRGSFKRLMKHPVHVLERKLMRIHSELWLMLRYPFEYMNWEVNPEQ